MGIIRNIAIFLSGFLMMAAFQNCGESLDLSQLESASTSTAPGVSLSYETASMVENTSYQIQLQIRNLTGYTIQWYKDDALLEGFEGDALIFEPAQLSDAGAYRASLIIDGEVAYSTESVTVSVSADTTVQTFANPVVTFNNQNYILRDLTAANTQTSDAFCKIQMGANAITTGHTINTMIQSLNYYANVDVACANGTQANGLCHRFDPGQFEPEINAFIGPFIRRIASVSCRPEPIGGL